MSELGEGASSAQINVNNPDFHWLEVNYCYPDGLPVVGSYVATDCDGMQYAGRLNDKGGLRLNLLPAGTVKVELIPLTSEEDELKSLRAQIKGVLDEILIEKRAETDATNQRLNNMSAVGQAGEVTWSFGKGLWNGAVGLFEFVWGVGKTAAEIKQYLSPVTRLNNLLEASYKTYRTGSMTQDKFYQSLKQNMAQAELDDLTRLLGFDPRKVDPALIAEAYEITCFIATDSDTHTLLMNFAKDYIGAQSTLDWAEFTGGGVFEIVLAALLIAFTGGVGLVAQAGSKVRHVNKLGKLGRIFRRLGKVLQRKQLNKQVKAPVDQKKKVEAEMPAGAKLSRNRLEEKKVKCFKKNKKGDPAEYDRQLKGQETGLNDMTAEEYLAGRKSYTGKRGSTESVREDYKKSLVDKYWESGMSKSEATAKASQEMKTLDALHNPDLIAGGKDRISDFGDSSVNRSIGSQWKNDGRLAELDKAAEDAIARGDGKKKLNVKMERCK